MPCRLLRQPRISAWATDLCRVWGGRDGWLTLALDIDCHTRKLLGWQLSRSGNAATAGAALEQTWITYNNCSGRIQNSFLLSADNGLVFLQVATTPAWSGAMD
jgi:putative transposase